MAEAADKDDKDCQYFTDHYSQSSAKFLEIDLYSLHFLVCFDKTVIDIIQEVAASSSVLVLVNF